MFGIAKQWVIYILQERKHGTRQLKGLLSTRSRNPSHVHKLKGTPALNFQGNLPSSLTGQGRRITVPLIPEFYWGSDLESASARRITRWHLGTVHEFLHQAQPPPAGGIIAWRDLLSVCKRQIGLK